MIKWCCIPFLLLGSIVCAQTSPAPVSVEAYEQQPFALEVIESAPAQYPGEAIAKRTQGTVSVIAVISPTGGVERVEATDGDSILQEAALASAKRYKFKSSKGPVKCWAQLVFDFRLDGGAGPASLPTQEIRGQLVHAEEFPVSVRVSESVMQGKLLKMVEPLYPRHGGDLADRGTVVLNARVGTDGKVQDLHLVSGSPKLKDAAETAARQWEYKPYIVMGEAVPVETRITMKFSRATQDTPSPELLLWMLQHNYARMREVTINQDSPRYPESAKQNGVQGVVFVGAEIDSNGKLTAFHVVKGDGLFGQAALDVASEQSIPATVKTGSSREQVLIVVHFTK